MLRTSRRWSTSPARLGRWASLCCCLLLAGGAYLVLTSSSCTQRIAELEQELTETRARSSHPLDGVVAEISLTRAAVRRGGGAYGAYARRAPPRSLGKRSNKGSGAAVASSSGEALDYYHVRRCGHGLP